MLWRVRGHNDDAYHYTSRDRGHYHDVVDDHFDHLHHVPAGCCSYT